jgi:molybdopterin-guanine dinucleotide biosynthesis protein A
VNPSYDAIVLAGGAARRLGGADKPGLLVGGRTLLDAVLAGCAAAARRIVVGPPREGPAGVLWCREDPPGGGPVAALAAGIAHARADTVVVLAADMPFAGAQVPGLVEAVAGHDGAVLVDAGGRDQPLAAAYRREALAARLAALPDGGAGVPVRVLVEGLDLARVADRSGAALDCDTWADVERARRAAERVTRAGEPAAGREDADRAG